MGRPVCKYGAPFPGKLPPPNPVFAQHRKVVAALEKKLVEARTALRELTEIRLAESERVAEATRLLTRERELAAHGKTWAYQSRARVQETLERVLALLEGRE